MSFISLVFRDGGGSVDDPGHGDLLVPLVEVDRALDGSQVHLYCLKVFGSIQRVGGNLEDISSHYKLKFPYRSFVFT